MTAFASNHPFPGKNQMMHRLDFEGGELRSEIYPTLFIGTLGREF